MPAGRPRRQPRISVSAERESHRPLKRRLAGRGNSVGFHHGSAASRRYSVNGVRQRAVTTKTPLVYWDAQSVRTRSRGRPTQLPEHLRAFRRVAILVNEQSDRHWPSTEVYGEGGVTYIVEQLPAWLLRARHRLPALVDRLRWRLLRRSLEQTGFDRAVFVGSSLHGSFFASVSIAPPSARSNGPRPFW